ncbi:YbhB/YbcL family Raf kinase inhibitor-like protein [Halorussus litoreus]|uniref:YbhB/YbcL family Raf kinase inhibitor-like protein n=1 Tax=Halorussus litoreus TaxID=1710536 RepID=UPI000E25E76D|nr:YbhB/YbcL family Raf kinase inhibitor-like protein [Halorussus litoreus]
MADLSFRTSAFTHGESLPEKYTCEGEDRSPELTIGDVPDDVHRTTSDAAHQNLTDSEDAATLAVVVDDPDAPGGTVTHWLLWNLPPDTVEIPENVPRLTVGSGAPRPTVQDEPDEKTRETAAFTGTFARE